MSSLDSVLFYTYFNYLCGVDIDFFVRCHAAGFLFWWCEEAAIYETVAQDRASAAWLMRRSMRTGAINYVIDRKRARSNKARALLLVKNVASLGLGVVRSIAMLMRTRKPLPSTHPILMSIGRTTASLGFLPTPYKAEVASSAAHETARLAVVGLADDKQ